jgi:hypothetical protein
LINKGDLEKDLIKDSNKLNKNGKKSDNDFPLDIEIYQKNKRT